MTGVSQLLSSMSSSLLQFTTDLHKHPEILNVSENDLLRNFLNGNFSLPNASVLLQQLDTIDNAACGWVHFMAKVRLHPSVDMQALGAAPTTNSWALQGQRGVRSAQISFRPYVGRPREETMASLVSRALGEM